MDNIALIKGDNRLHNIKNVLNIFKDKLIDCLENVRSILIKPNVGMASVPIGITSVESVAELVSFLRNFYSEEIIVCEGIGVGYNSLEDLKIAGYQQLVDKFGVKLLDLNNDETVDITLVEQNLNPFTARISKQAANASFRISICPPKTHDFVVVTLSIKNIAVGSLSRVGKDYKSLIHQGYQAMNFNLFLLAKALHPHFSLIDGFTGMEGDGPWGGDKVEFKIALGSFDSVAADSMAAYLMGFNLSDIGYLNYCARFGLGRTDWKNMKIIGNCHPEDVLKKFKPHSTFAAQKKWQGLDLGKFHHLIVKH